MRKPREGVVLFLALLFLVLPIVSARSQERVVGITGREIVERLTRLEEGQKALKQEMEQRFKAVDQRFKAVDQRFEALDKRIDDLRSEMNGQFNSLRWLINLFVAVALVILGFVLRMQWQMNKRMTHVETSLETQKDELAFLKGLIERLLPPRSAL